MIAVVEVHHDPITGAHPQVGNQRLRRRIDGVMQLGIRIAPVAVDQRRLLRLHHPRPKEAGQAAPQVRGDTGLQPFLALLQRFTLHSRLPPERGRSARLTSCGRNFTVARSANTLQ